MPDVAHIAASLRDSAAKALAEQLSEQSLLRPGQEDETRAWSLLKSKVADENRRRILEEGCDPLNEEEQEAIQTEIYDSLFRLGPLQRFVDDPEIEEVICNGASTGFVIRSGGRKEQIDTGLRDDEALRSLVVRAAARVGRRLDEASPSVDVHLPEGRLHGIIPPLSKRPCLTIRVQRLGAESLGELVELQTMTPEASRFLSSAVAGGLNLLVSGGTGSGKTTTLHALGREIPEWERVVTIEETPELGLDELLPDCVALTSRFANIEGRGEITIRDLVRHALRMRPSRIIVGEVRGSEALDMLSAMNTGHEGSACTLHANSARQALTKLELYAMSARDGMGAGVVSRMIAETIDLIVQLRLDHSTGRRMVESIVEVNGMEGGRVLVNDIFESHQGVLRWTGLTPKCAERIEGRGIDLGLPRFAEAM